MSELSTNTASPHSSNRPSSTQQLQPSNILKASASIEDTPEVIDLRARSKLGEKDVQGCLDILNAGIQRWPNSGLLCARIVAFCVASGRHQDAMDAIDNFLNFEGESHEALNKSLVQFFRKYPHYSHCKQALPILDTLTREPSRVVNLPGVHLVFDLIISDYLKHLAKEECSQATFSPFEVKAREIMSSLVFSSAVISTYEAELKKTKQDAWEPLVRAAAFFEVTSRTEIADRLLNTAIVDLAASRDEIVRSYVLLLPNLGMLNAYGEIFLRFSKELFPENTDKNETAINVYREEKAARSIARLATASLSSKHPEAPKLCLRLVNLLHELDSDVNALQLVSVLNAASPGLASDEQRTRILLRYLHNETEPNLQLCKDVLLSLSPSSKNTEDCATIIMEKLLATKGDIAATKFLDTLLHKKIVPRIGPELANISILASQLARIQAFIHDSKFELAWEEVESTFPKISSTKDLLFNRTVTMCLRADGSAALNDLFRTQRSSKFKLDFEVAIECIIVGNQSSNLPLLSEVYWRMAASGLTPPQQLLESSHSLAVSRRSDQFLPNACKIQKSSSQDPNPKQIEITSFSNAKNLIDLIHTFQDVKGKPLIGDYLEKRMSELCRLNRPQDALQTLKLCLSYKIYVQTWRICEIIQAFYTHRMWSEGAQLFRDLESALPSATLAPLAELSRKSQDYTRAIELCDAALLNPILNSTQREHALVVRLYALSFLNRQQFLDEVKLVSIPQTSSHRTRFLCLLCFNGLVKHPSPEFFQYLRELKSARRDPRRAKALHADVNRAIATLYKARRED